MTCAALALDWVHDKLNKWGPLMTRTNTMAIGSLVAGGQG